MPAACFRDCLAALEGVPASWQHVGIDKVKAADEFFQSLPSGLQLKRLLRECWGLLVSFDHDDNINGVELVCEVFPRDEVLYALAPYVSDGSHLDFRGEDGQHWRYLFHGGKCVRQQARLVWDD